MDEKTITEAAQSAVNDLHLDCRVESVFKHSRQGKWCIKFTGAYGQFCNEFRNEAGQENSARLVREKIKGFLFKVRKPGRDRRARRSFTANAGQQGDGLLETPLEFVGEAVERTSRIIGGLINQVSNLAGTVLESQAAVSVDLPSPAPHSRAPRKKKKEAEEPPVKIPVRKTSKKTGRKTSSRAGKPSLKASKKGAQKRTSKKPKAAKAKKAGRKRGRKNTR